ncbi:MAG TPA: pyruvate kinase [Polyangiaceae bacterium]|jgi:pyruvate kinase|nr:pyruvate kinase [Polyangiaceae bacterium]
MQPIERTKIIATIGPATASLDRIRELIRAGADACRVNFSHGDGSRLGPLMQTIREAARLEKRPIAILADIQGPKLRIGSMPAAGALLVEGNTFTLTPRDVTGSDTEAHTAHERLAEDVEPGARILLADGAIELIVESVAGRDVVCRVVTGGRLYSHKGLNLPGRKVSAETLTDKDREDLAFLAGTDVDLIAISFVRSAADLKLARELLGPGRKIPVIAKLERPEAIACLDQILDASDGIMVARGDLGVELPFEQVPVIQKRILTRASRRGKWTIVATQMLASMVVSRRPSRAEASDVLNAVLDGADAVMLSEETAVGDNPVLAVKAMDALTRSAEEYDRGARDSEVDTDAHSFSSSAAGAAVLAANQLRASAIVTLAGSGLTALHVSKWLPRLPIVALSSSPATLRRTNLLRGVCPVEISQRADVEQQLEFADVFLMQAGWAKEGDVVVMVAAVPLGAGKETNTIRFHRVRKPGSPSTLWPGA